jgi:hypothetical protein
VQSAKHAVPAGAGLAVAVVPAFMTGAAAPPAPVSHPAVAALDVEVVRQMPPPRPLVTRFVRASARKAYTIVSGDTLSGIAGRWCGSAGKWPALFNGNRKAVRDPDLIYPGQHLTLTCDGSMALKAADTADVAPVTTAPVRQAAPASAPAHHDRWDGHHGNCGDGDGDGMDAPCSVIFPQQASDPAPHSSVRQAAVTGVSVRGGTLSFAGLEALWESAGGPAWAEVAAATIAECESGGNQYAHNPSGASGYWQILGQVVGGNVYDPMVNAENAVSKFRASGDTFAQWVCQA